MDTSLGELWLHILTLIGKLVDALKAFLSDLISR